MPDFSEILFDTPLFKNVSAEDIPIMLKKLGAYVKTYKKGNFIRRTGDAADFIGIILEGSIQILQNDYDGNRSITATISRGKAHGLFK